MQTANILLSLGGDSGNTVPKFGVTAAEIAVLRLIHGDESVRDVQPTGDVKRSSRDERQRLVEKYGKQENGKFSSPAVNELFPGVAARVFEDLEELDLPEEFYKAETRVTARSAPKKQAATPAEAERDVESMTKAELVDLAKAEDIPIDASAKKADIVASIAAARAERQPAEEDGADEDGIGEMNDGVGKDENLFG